MVCLTQSSAQIIRIHYLTELEGGGGGGRGGGMSILSITQKVLIVVASDRVALRVSVMQWILEFILSIVQHNECSYGFLDSHQQEVS